MWWSSGVCMEEASRRISRTTSERRESWHGVGGVGGGSSEVAMAPARRKTWAPAWECVKEEETTKGRGDRDVSARPWVEDGADLLRHGDVLHGAVTWEMEEGGGSDLVLPAWGEGGGLVGEEVKMRIDN